MLSFFLKSSKKYLESSFDININEERILLKDEHQPNH